MNTFLDQRVLNRLRAEYLEMPGMKLTIELVQRLCGIEQTMCKLVLDALVKTSFLCLQSDGTYVLCASDWPSGRRDGRGLAWKSTPVARADAHQIPATHFRFNDFRNIDARERVPVTDRV